MEFTAFSSCLDKHNTRIEDCKRAQRKFFACWNKEPETEQKKE